MTGASLDFPACFTKNIRLALFRKDLDQHHLPEIPIIENQTLAR